MIRIHISAEWIAAVGLVLALPSVWAWMAFHQAGNPAGIAWAVTGAAASLVMIIEGVRRS